MSFLETLELQDKFVFQISHHGVLNFEKEPLEKNVIKHYEKFSHTIAMPELEGIFYYYINFSAIDPPSNKMCSQLKDNLCSIYSERPISCQLQPFDPFLPEENQDKVFELYEKIIHHPDVKQRWLCETDSSQPIVWQNKSITKTHDEDLFYSYLKEIRVFTDDYLNYLNEAGKNYLNEHFRTVFLALKQGSTLLSDMIIALQVALWKGFATSERIISFIEAQIVLIDKKIANSLNSKIKEDRQTTELYKKQRDEYKKALKQKVFLVDYNDSINFS